MQVIVFAYHDIGVTGIESLLEHGYKILKVFTHVDSKRENCFFRSVAKLCAHRGIPFSAPESIHGVKILAEIKALAPDFIFSFYYRYRLSKEILAVPVQGAFNLHGSLLPAYRGCAPVNWVLIHGEQSTGVTLHKMEPDFDSGALVAQLSVVISDEDTALSLHKKLNLAAKKLLDRQLPNFKKLGICLTPQDPGQGSYFGRRTAKDGLINWHKDARTLYNLCRAVTEPYPGAFTYAGAHKMIIWQARVLDEISEAEPGTVISTEPFCIACKNSALEVVFGQVETGPYMPGSALAKTLGLVTGMCLGDKVVRCRKNKKVLILGINGFIGYHLAKKLLQDDRFEVFGMDLAQDAIARLSAHPRLHFFEGDMTVHKEWLEYHIKKCDVILPLVAIATPMEYTRNPLKVFELDFEENLKIVKTCVKYAKRIVFPSTSEVYGMCEDDFFDEDHSALIVGPIAKQRWIYSVSKQLLDRVIWAYGQNQQLSFTLFRPFNWMGPRLDSLKGAKKGRARAITQFILNLIEGTPIKLVDGGAQKRCFTDIDDGINALVKIIQNPGGICDNQIINIGNPDNEASISTLATMLLDAFEKHPMRNKFPKFAGFSSVENASFYGQGYQDVSYRKPNIEKSQRLLQLTPQVSLQSSIDKVLDFFIQQALESYEIHSPSR